MSKDPAFLFYPGDWLGGTIGMTHEEKGAYIDLLMCQFNSGHMTKDMIGRMLGQNKQQLWSTLSVKFIQDEDGLYYNVKLESEQMRRRSYSESRKNNRKGENQHTKKDSKKLGHMTSHMETETVNVNETDNSFEKSEKLFLEGNTELMGFKGQARIWIEKEKHYIWDKQDEFAIVSIEKKIKEVHRRGSMQIDKESILETFQMTINNLPEWIKNNKFSLTYIDQKFNEIIHAIHNEPNIKKPGSAPLSRQDEARLRAILESGALLGVD